MNRRSSPGSFYTWRTLPQDVLFTSWQSFSANSSSGTKNSEKDGMNSCGWYGPPIIPTVRETIGGRKMMVELSDLSDHMISLEAKSKPASLSFEMKFLERSAVLPATVRDSVTQRQQRCCSPDPCKRNSKDLLLCQYTSAPAPRICSLRKSKRRTF